MTNKSKDDIIKSSKRERKSKATEIKKIKKLKKGLTKQTLYDIIKSSKKTKSKLRKNEVGNYDKQNDKQSSP